MLYRHFTLAVACLLISEVYSISSANEQALLKALMKNYEKTIMPKPDNGPLQLEFGFSLITLRIDEQTGDADLFGWEKYSWIDERLSWNPAENNNIEEIRVDGKYIWSPHPDWTLYNSIQIEADIMDQAMMVIWSNGKVLWIPRSRRSNMCSYTGGASYHCNLKFGSWVRHDQLLMPSIYGNASAIEVEEYLENNIWDVSDLTGKVEVKKYDCCPEGYPSMAFNFTATKKEGRGNAMSHASSSIVSFCLLFTTAVYSLVRSL